MRGVRVLAQFPRHNAVPSRVAFVVGLGLVFLVPGMLVATFVEWGSSTSHDEWALLAAALLTLAVGGTVMAFTRLDEQLPPASVFAAVVGTWAASSLAGSLPLWFSGEMGSFDDALFESVSGLTATGSTVLGSMEGVGRGVLMWRQITQWYGGMGMVVLAVTVLPFLRVGGLGLITAEAPGPTSDKLAPRVSSTARRLWVLYSLFTVAMAVGLLVTGMSLYDAAAHAFTTVSTGGFTPNEASVGHYDSLVVELVLIVGMLVCGASFTLHWRAATNPKVYWRSAELRTYVGIIAAVALLAATLNWLNDLEGFTGALRNGAFNAVALGTSTGFGNTSAANPGGNFAAWVPGAQALLLPLLVIGGMTGSTAGGLKVFRAQVMMQYARSALIRMRHPSAKVPVKLGGQAQPDAIVQRVAGLLVLYVLMASAATMTLAALGTDFVTSSSGAISALSNMGPALGEAGPTATFEVFSRPARGVIMVLMFIGRLEFFAVLLVLVALQERVRRTIRVQWRGRNAKDLPKAAVNAAD